MLVLFLALVHLNYDSSNIFVTNRDVRHRFSLGLDETRGNRNSSHVVKLRSIPDFWQWSSDILARSLHYNELKATENFGYLLGPPQFRQIRGKAVSCPASQEVNMHDVPRLVTRSCVGDPSDQSGTVWSPGADNWTLYSSSEIEGFSKFGQLVLYPGGGYVQKLGASYNQTLTTLSRLKANHWLDSLTRAVFVELSLYHPSLDLTSCVTILLEFPTSGGLLASCTVWSERLLKFKPSVVSPIMVCQVMFLLFVLYWTFRVISSLRSQRLLYLTHLHSWMDIFIGLLMWANSGLYVACVVLATRHHQPNLADVAAPARLETVVLLHSVLGDVQAFLGFLLISKIFGQSRFIRPLYKFYTTLTTACSHLMGVLLMFIILLLTFAQLGYLLYGRATYSFHSYQHSLLALASLMNSRIHWPEAQESQATLTHLFFLSSVVFGYGLVVTLSVALLTWSLRWSRDQLRYKNNLETADYEMVDFFIKQFKRITGIQKQKPAFRHVKFEGLPSLSSHSAGSVVSQDSGSVSICSDWFQQEADAEHLDLCLASIQPSWHLVAQTVHRIEALEQENAAQLEKVLNKILLSSPTNIVFKPKPSMLSKQKMSKSLPLQSQSNLKSSFLNLTLSNSSKIVRSLHIKAGKQKARSKQLPPQTSALSASTTNKHRSDLTVAGSVSHRRKSQLVQNQTTNESADATDSLDSRQLKGKMGSSKAKAASQKKLDKRTAQSKAKSRRKKISSS